MRAEAAQFDFCVMFKFYKGYGHHGVSSGLTIKSVKFGAQLLILAESNKEEFE